MALYHCNTCGFKVPADHVDAALMQAHLDDEHPTKTRHDDGSVLADFLAAATTLPDETPEQLWSRVQAGVGFDGSTSAYDGSSEPQSRDLTARERDVLCALISDVVSSVREHGDVRLNGLRGGQDWLNHLIIMREVIDPRRD